MEPRFRELKTPEKERFKGEQEEPEIKSKEIAELEEPMKNILWQMERRIESGEYPVILGVDKSGRLPAILFREVLTIFYKEKGFPPPEIFPFAGYKFKIPAQKEKIIQDFKNHIGKGRAIELLKDKKILVVDDTLLTGEHLRPYMKALKELNINFEIAIINLLRSPKFAPPTVVIEPTKEDFEKDLGGNIFLGKKSISNLLIWENRRLSGFKKSPEEEPELFVKSPSEFVKSEADKQDYLQKKSEAKQARRDVKILAKKLVQWYKEEILNK